MHFPVARAVARGTGFQIFEVLIVLAITGLVAVMGLPGLLGWTRAVRLRVAAAEVAATLQIARSEAIRRGTRVGLKFSVPTDGRITWTLYRDGDGDGLRSGDIASGVDPAITAPRALAHQGRRVTFGFPPGPPPTDPADPGRRLDRLDDPLRLGRTDIATFNPLGGGSSGSFYLTDGIRGLVAIRLLGRTGRIRILTYDPEAAVWI